MCPAAGSFPVTLRLYRVPAPLFSLSLSLSLPLSVSPLFLLSRLSLLSPLHLSSLPPCGPSKHFTTWSPALPPHVHKHAPHFPKPTPVQWPKPGLLTGIICNSLTHSLRNITAPLGPSGFGSSSLGSFSALPPVSALSSVPTFSLNPWHLTSRLYPHQPLHSHLSTPSLGACETVG